MIGDGFLREHVGDIAYFGHNLQRLMKEPLMSRQCHEYGCNEKVAGFIGRLAYCYTHFMEIFSQRIQL